MDGGAWWATVHGFTRVGHDLVTKQQQLRRFSSSLPTQSHGKREENQCPHGLQTDPVNGSWGHWSYHSWEQGHHRAEHEGGEQSSFLSRCASQLKGHQCYHVRLLDRGGWAGPYWRNYHLLVARVHRETTVYRLLTFNSWVSSSIKVLKLISLRGRRRVLRSTLFSFLLLIFFHRNFTM